MKKKYTLYVENIEFGGPIKVATFEKEGDLFAICSILNKDLDQKQNKNLKYFGIVS